MQLIKVNGELAICDKLLVRRKWNLVGLYECNNVLKIIPRSTGCCFSVTHLANVSIEVDGEDRGIRSLKLESPLGELEQLLKTVLEPVEFMCQVWRKERESLRAWELFVIEMSKKENIWPITKSSINPSSSRPSFHGENVYSFWRLEYWPEQTSD